MGVNKQYAEKYAEFAMEQMRKYGIPASVTLAQAILESQNGRSELAIKENNHFGIKATKGWLDGGGKYGLYTDDKPNEKFCSYKSVADSYEHHSKFLAENKRYAACFKLSPDDYKGWTEGIAKAGYASGGNYAASLQNIIEINGFDKYDRMVMEEMRSQGKEFGVGKEQKPAVEQKGTGYSFPVKRDEFMLVTSPFGMRKDPMDPSKQQMHKGIDIQCKNDRLLATENNGKVVAVNQNPQTAGGKSVTLEYSMEDGTKMQCTYMHLSEVNVKVNDVVQAGDAIGVSGNTGTRTTGEHLHFGVKAIAADGTSRDIDPAAYLADIAQKGNIKIQALHNGKDLLESYKQEQTETVEDVLAQSPDEWLKKLMSSEDSGVKMGNEGDPIINLACQLFMGIMSVIAMLNGQDNEEKMEAATQAAVNKSVDLKPLFPNMKSCEMTIYDNKPMLNIDTGTVKINHQLTNTEYTKLVQTLGDSSLSVEDKRQRITTMVSGIVATNQASQNFEQQMDASRSKDESVKIR